MKQNIADRAEEIIRPIAESLGYFLVEIVYKKEFNSMALNVVIDKANGIDISDCEKLSKAIDEPLDIADITMGKPYNLNVSSYGLDRSLKTEYDFNKFKNQEIDIKFYTPKIEGKKEIVAILKDFDLPNKIIVIFNNKEIDLNLKEIANIVPFIKF